MTQGFQSHQGTALPLDQANVDTDQIIPKQFLTAVTRSGYGKHLFHDWRYLDLHEQEPNPDFVLNKPQYQSATVLLARENFGCGSSREHAPWSLADYGFDVIIAPSYADIFYDNCLNNQLLPVQLTPTQMNFLFDRVVSESDTIIHIDLANQKVLCGTDEFKFDIDAQNKENMMKGLDAIGQTLELDSTINHFEGSIPPWRD
jgi:3-isopropylmalate/(R)-2-methylmalate dehydratase small subunit